MTVSLWPASGSVTVTWENGAIPTPAVSAWPACVPARVGGVLATATAVEAAVTVVELSDRGSPPLETVRVKVVVTDCPGPTSWRVGVKTSAWMSAWAVALSGATTV